MKKNRFGISLFAYVIVLSAVIACGLQLLYHFLQAYEQAQPGVAVEAFEAQMQDSFQDYLRHYAQECGDAIQTPEAIYEDLQSQLDLSTLNLRKNPALSGESLPGYTIRLGKQPVGQLHLRYGAEKHFGYGACQVDSVAWKLEGDYRKIWTVEAPEDAAVLANGVLLTSENADIIDVGSSTIFPRKMITFACFGTPEITAEGLENARYTITQTEQTVSVQAEFAEEPEQVREIAENFVRNYIAYSSHAGNIHGALAFVDPGSELRRRIVASNEGMTWVTGITWTLGDLTLDSFAPVEEGVVCRAHYDLTDRNGQVRQCEMRLLLKQMWNTWRVSNMELS